MDALSSAHVYLRLSKGERLEDLPPETIIECAQLVKANSIEGCKLREVTVIYTRWRNLHKTSDMEVGSIGFHDRSKVKSMNVIKENSIVNALNRTKEVCHFPFSYRTSLMCLLWFAGSQERFPNLAELQEARAAEHRAELKHAKREQATQEKKERREREEAAKLRSYEYVVISSSYSFKSCRIKYAQVNNE